MPKKSSTKSKTSASTTAVKTKNKTTKKTQMRSSQEKIRYGVLGLGHIAQNSVLPAFAHAKSNSELVALISNNDEKLTKLGKEYNIDALYTYDQIEECIANEKLDAVYIALPNKMHKDFALRVIEGGAHVLCEKPLGISSEECELLYRAARARRVYLMTAYRLHFDEKNMEIVRMIKQNTIGQAKFFSSVFSFQVAQQNIRLSHQLGGGVLFDVGVYPINAARYIFQAEPTAVMGKLIYHEDERFSEVEGTCSAVLFFPEDRIAQFTCSFAAADSSSFDVVGTKGCLRLDNAYEIKESAELKISADGKEQTKKFEAHDQFSAELVYFSKCILTGQQPEPSAKEAKADLEIIEAIRRSSQSGQLISLKSSAQVQYPDESQIIKLPPFKGKPLLVEVSPPHGTNGTHQPRNN